MNFFQTIGAGYKLMWEDVKFKWQKNGAHFLTMGGTGMMLVSSIFIARKGSKDEVQQAIAEANAVIDEIRNAPVENEKPMKRKFRLAKAKAKKAWHVGKHFWKEGLMTAAGAGMVVGGDQMHIGTEHKLGKAVAAEAALFAAYRANVVADQGEAKDLEYMRTTRKKLKPGDSVVMSDGTVIQNPEGDTDGDVILKPENGWNKFWFSRETCPSIWSDNLELRKHKLEAIENNLTILGQTNGHLSVNDQAREFADMGAPYKLDTSMGSIMGRIFDYHKDPDNWRRPVDLGWRKDEDFCNGVTEGCWLFWQYDPEPMITQMKKKQTVVEDRV